MTKYTWLAVLIILLHLAIVGNWFIVIKNWKDPNFDIARKWLFGLLLAAIFVVGGFKVAKNEFKMFQDDVNNAKQEQVQ